MSVHVIFGVYRPDCFDASRTKKGLVFICGEFCLSCFCLTSQVNSYGHGGTVSSPNHTLSWANLNKQLTSTSCTYWIGIELATTGSAARLPCGKYCSKLWRYNLARGKWLKLIHLWRHEASFDSQIITILCIIVFSDEMIILSTLQHF